MIPTVDCLARMDPASDRMAARRDDDLVVRCESPLPVELEANSANAIFCAGSCFHRHAGIERLWILTPGRRMRVRNHGLPRLGLYRDLQAPGSELDPEARSYRSGFNAVVPVGPLQPGDMPVEVVADLEDGRKVSAPFASIPVTAPSPAAAGPLERSPKIAVCMATYEPDLELFEVQVQSIRDQAGDWICFISDDYSPEEDWRSIRRIVGDDPRFVVSRAEGRIGFFRNFERVLSMVPEGVEYVALCDQDDRWYPDKLETLAAAMGDNQLVYSDQRLTLRDGSVIRDSLWVGRRRNDDSVYSMTIANTIVGASTMMRRDLLTRILPFPRTPGWQFHDTWISAVAIASGSIRFVDRPLYDYVQHERAIVSRVSVEGEEDLTEAPGILWSLRHPRRVLERWKSIYYRSFIHTALQAVVLVERCSDRMSRREIGALGRLATADTTLRGTLELAVRPAREIWGRNETLGTEWHLLAGILWLRFVKLRELGRRRSPSGARQDVAVPEFDIVSFAQWRMKRWIRRRSSA